MRRPRPLPLAALLLALAAAARADAPPAPPPPPTEGFGAEASPAPELERGEVDNPVAAAVKVTWFRPKTVAADAGPLPVVGFFHGFGAPGPEPYRALLEHLARRGALVVFPTYPALDARSAYSRYDTMWAGFEAGLAAARARAGPAADPARLGLLGHSFGGAAAPAMAARAQARGYGRDALWVGCFAPWYDLDVEAWEVLPAHARLLVALFEDDEVCDPSIGATYLARAKTLPASRKAVRVFRSDRHGRPGLRADHLTPVTTPRLDALDVRGVWRVADALAAAALTGDPAATAVALGGGEDALSMGTWTDGTPVRPALASWTTPVGTAPRSLWRLGGKQEEWMRRLLRPEAWSTLPLPDPASAPPARLSASERFVDRPDVASPLPQDVEAARAAGPVLVVDAEAPPVVGEARLRAAGIAVVRREDGVQRAPAGLRGTTAMLLDAAGRPRLWRRADDPRLVDVALALLAPR